METTITKQAMADAGLTFEDKCPHCRAVLRLHKYSEQNDAYKCLQKAEADRVAASRPIFEEIPAIGWEFVETFNALAAELNRNSREKGFYSKPCSGCGGTGHKTPRASYPTVSAECNACRGTGEIEVERNIPEMLCLVHSEISEALEAIRRGNPADKHCPEFLNVEIELADALIRIAEMAHSQGWRIAEAIIAKHKYNTTRPKRHGKAF
jgi:NTP pyrophosphatase (non-canonical NTP hydrolase)